MALVIMLGAGLRFDQIKARIIGAFWHSQEILLLGFVAIVVLSRFWGETIDMSVRDLSATSQLPADKMPKVALFVLLMTHIMVRYQDFTKLWWLLILVGGLYVGWDAFTATDTPSRFVHGRLDILGGADFNEANTGATHLAFVCVLAGCQFLKDKRWIAKGLCLATGVFGVNAIIMTQSRSALVGLGVGSIAAVSLAPRKYRSRLCLGLAIAALGAFSLTNDYFWQRASTISVNTEEASAASRFDLWKAGLAMWMDYPMGVGAGSFYTVVGRYNPAYIGRDCHNTYIRCASELGVLGILCLMALIYNAFVTLRRVNRLAYGTRLEQDVTWDSYALQVGLLVFLVPGMFIGLTYIEETWWILALPVCLERAVLHARHEMLEQFWSLDLSRATSDRVYRAPDGVGATEHRPRAEADEREPGAVEAFAGPRSNSLSTELV
jgi:O-antigen ligase